MQLPSTNERDDFQAVAGQEEMLCMPLTRDKLEVYFDGDIAGRQIQLPE
jgi:hypothetical protein